MARPARPAASEGAPFDYGALTVASRITVVSLTTRIRERIGRTAADVIATGRDLAAVRDRLDRGQFQRWLAAEFAWCQATAYRLIGVAQRFGQATQIATIAPSALYALAAPSTPEAVRAEALALAAAGEPVTHAKAQELIARVEHAPAVGVMTAHDRFKAHPCVAGRTRHAGTFPTLQEAVAAVDRVKEYAERLGDLTALAAAGRFESREWSATVRRLSALYGDLTDAERRLVGRLAEARAG